jgi:PPOX class probable F420-dependent enzyme
MATNMSEQGRRTFLAAGTRTAKVAVSRGDGTPHVVPVWFVLDGDIVVFTTGERTVKGHAVRRDPRVSICVDDQAPPFSFVMIEGLATISRDPDELLTWATRIGARYMGEDRAAEFGRRNAVPEELLVRVTPTKIVAIGGMTD